MGYTSHARVTPGHSLNAFTAGHVWSALAAGKALGAAVQPSDYRTAVTTEHVEGRPTATRLWVGVSGSEGRNRLRRVNPPTMWLSALAEELPEDVAEHGRRQ
jgi:hypothetical protein